MLKEEIIKKYKNEERLVVSKILDKIVLADKSKKIVNTDFLDLGQQALAKKLLQQIKKDVIFYGGYEKSERKAIFIIPEKYENPIDKLQIKYDDYIGIIRIQLSQKIKEKYTHRNYLGALMKLGVKREKIRRHFGR